MPAGSMTDADMQQAIGLILRRRRTLECRSVRLPVFHIIRRGALVEPSRSVTARPQCLPASSHLSETFSLPVAIKQPGASSQRGTHLLCDKASARTTLAAHRPA